MTDQPNILFIHSDQHRFDALGVNGNPTVKTPNLDRLANEGMNFTNAYTPCPVCTPARASLLTGQWAFKHLNITIHQWTEVPRVHKRGLPTFSMQLKNAGYDMGCVGKWHVDYEGEMMPADVGFDDYIGEGEYNRWREAQGIEWPDCRTPNWDIAGKDPDYFDQVIRGGVDDKIEVEQSRLRWGADNVINMLSEKKENTQPFFIRWDPSEPHLPNHVPEPFASMYEPGEIEPWGSLGDAFEGKPYIQNQQRHTWNIDNWEWERDWAPIVARYYGEVSLLDHEIGRVLAALEDNGLAENTIVVYSTDHGDMTGSHGLIDKHCNMYDDITHVPLIIKWPGVTTGAANSDFISHALDLAATFCEWGNVEVPDTFQGTSLAPALKGESYDRREDILSSYHGGQFGLYSCRMLRDDKWKYVWNLTDTDELYDLQADPWEVENRASDPACADILKEKRKRMAVVLEDAQDPILHTWTRFQLKSNRKR